MERKVFLNRAEEIAYEREQSRRRAEGDTHGDILPLRKGEDGIELAVPQWMKDAWNTLTLPRDTLQGHQPTEDDIAEFALNVAGGGTSASSAFTPNADLGMFVGKKANLNNAQQTAYNKAIKLAEEGKDRDTIWAETGWFQGPDAQWRTEINDENFDFNSFGKVKWSQMDELEQRNAPLRGIIEHPELFEAYPDLTTVDTTIGKLPKKGETQLSGRYDPNVDIMSSEGKTLADVKTTLLHEIQHAVQQREGWSGGSNPDAITHRIRPLFNILPAEAVNYLEIKKKVVEQTSEIGKMINLRDRLRAGEPVPELKSPDGWGSAGDDEWGWLRGLDQENQIKYLNEVITSDTAILELTLNDQADAYVMIEPIVDTVEDVASMLSWQPFDWYQRNAGEAEARVVQKRADYTDEERQLNPPWQDLDVSEEELWDNPNMFQRFIDDVKAKLKENGYLDRDINDDDLYEHMRAMRRL